MTELFIKEGPSLRKGFCFLVLLVLVAAMPFPMAAFAGMDSLTLSSNLAGATPEYRIQYSIGGGEQLYKAKDDYILVTFSDQVELPAEIPATEVTVNTVNPNEVKVDKTQGSIKIPMPMDLILNRSADIIIKPGAGIKNPAKPGTYSISLMSSKTQAASQNTYKIISGTVSTPLVEVVPASPSELAEYTISFYVSADGGLVGGTDTISLSFPQDMTLPYTVSKDSITVNDRTLDTGDMIAFAGKNLTFKVPYGASVEPGGRVTVKVKFGATIKNPAQGKYKIIVATSGDIVPVASEEYYISGPNVMDLQVNLSATVAESPAQYGIKFRTSHNGSLKGGIDSISIEFPYQSTLTPQISRNNIEVQGTALNTGTVSVKDKTVSFLVPTGVDVGPGKWVEIKINSAANIGNPREAGHYYLKVFTSRDQTPTTSNSFRIADKKTVKLVVGSSTALVDGRSLSLDVPATIINGRTLVPVRFVAESLGAQVNWNGDNREVIISQAGKTITMTIDSESAMVNGKLLTLDTSPIIKDGRTMMPIRFVAENLGFATGWDDSTQTVTIKN